MIRPPVLIYATPRSGSSLITRIFHEHGFWVGDHVMKAEYPNYENIDLKNALRTIVWRSRDERGNRYLKKGYTKNDFRNIVAEIVPHDTPWVFKTGLWRIMTRYLPP